MADNVTILIPTALRPKVDNQEAITASGGSVKDVLASLTAQYPELGKQLFKNGATGGDATGGGGEVNRFINLYVNDEDIRFLDNLETQLKDGDELSIVPAIAGG